MISANQKSSWDFNLVSK